MQIVNKIDELIKNLNDLRPTISDDNDVTEKKFTELLKLSMGTLAGEQSDFDNSPSKKDKKNEHLIPTWVNPDYKYDPNNPRKPNMRELMEAITGKSVEEIYAEPSEKWKTISSNVSEALYGVIGSNKDTRDWHAIMAADDILLAAKEATGKMYEPKVAINSHYDDGGMLTGQTAVLKDKNEKVLRTIPTDIDLAEETLKKFGALRLRYRQTYSLKLLQTHLIKIY